MNNVAYSAPALLSSGRIVGNSTDDEPEVDGDGGTLEAGTTWYHADTGAMRYWTGTAWKPVTNEQVSVQTLNILFDIRDLLSGE